MSILRSLLREERAYLHLLWERGILLTVHHYGFDYLVENWEILRGPPNGSNCLTEKPMVRFNCFMRLGPGGKDV